VAAALERAARVFRAARWASLSVHALLCFGCLLCLGGTLGFVIALVLPTTISPLFEAAAAGELDAVRELLAAGVAPDVGLSSWLREESPLFWAALEGHTNVVQVLLAAGASPQKGVSMGPALHSLGGLAPFVGPSLGSGGWLWRENPLSAASFHNHPYTVQALLNGGADASAPALIVLGLIESEAPLHQAREEGHTQVAALLEHHLRARRSHDGSVDHAGLSEHPLTSAPIRPVMTVRNFGTFIDPAISSPPLKQESALQFARGTGQATEGVLQDPAPDSQHAQSGPLLKSGQDAPQEEQEGRELGLAQEDVAPGQEDKGFLSGHEMALAQIGLCLLVISVLLGDFHE
jgi:hypothetical protein